MTVQPASPPLLPSPHSVVSAYETLRQQSLGTHLSPHPGHGLALLRTKGVPAWLSAYGRAAPAPSSQKHEPTVPLPGGLRAELTVILAGMALGASHQGVFP